MATTSGNQVDEAIAHRCNEIKLIPYAKSIVSEDVIERNFGYKIIRQQVSHGKNSLIYKCESVKHPNSYCLIKPYRLGRDRVKLSLREETCQIMKFVTAKCANILSTYDIFYTNEKIYLMCDWSSKGEVLAALRQRSVRLNEEMLRTWAIDILSAINFLHNNAICHRNIAPSCLLLTSENRVKIGTLSDAVIYCKPDGSLIKFKWPKFSRRDNWNQPPEVAKGKPYDARRADIWSLGATIYWFITRSHPIDYRSTSRLTKQLEHRMLMMRKVTNRCHKFVQKLLTFQPAQRPTLTQALELEWITVMPSGAPGAKTPEATAAAEITNERVETGEAVGPEESSAEAEASGQAEPQPQISVSEGGAGPTDTGATESPE